MASSKKDQRRAARDRMREEREALARREKLRGRVLIGGALVAVLALAVGIGMYAANSSGSADSADEGPASSSSSRPTPPARTGS